LPARTFAIGDIHGDLAALERLLGRLPALRPQDSVVFLGDYVDRGPDSRGVIERVRRVQAEAPCRVVTLRGNHEDKWIECWDEPAPGFLLQRGNGCVEMYRDFVGKPPLAPGEEPETEDIVGLIEVRKWLPPETVEWMKGLPLWYEDDHAIYVHAGLDGEGEVWQHPSQGRPRPLMWMREPDFFRGYRGKRLLFGHTVVTDLPLDHVGPIGKLFDDPKDVWVRGDLVGLDTGCGKGGFLSAVELPRMKVYESR
jgi:serine/threonine protein phosphatase 1